MDFAPGDRLSDALELERELGAGGMGTVWVARHGALGSQVAVKILARIKGARRDQLRARFEQEARLVAQLDHPHIVKVFDLGITMDGDPFIVMELLKGEDLSQRVKRVGRLSIEEVTTLVQQTCAALSCAHEAGIIHRDIKPANIFLMEGAGGPFVKLVDFGVAKLTAGNAQMTKTGELIGTPHYMSPEQFLRPKDIDARSDLWSLAVVAYAALTGALPFIADTVPAMGMAVASGDFKPPRAHREELSLALDHFMSRALSADPAKRYPTAKDFAGAFARAAVAGAVPSIAPTAPARAVQDKTEAMKTPDPPPRAIPLVAPQAPQGPTLVSAPLPPKAAPAGGSRWLLLGAAVLIAAVCASAATYALTRKLAASASAAQRSGSPPTDFGSASSSDYGPAAFETHGLPELYARAARIAKARDSRSELSSISVSMVQKNGMIGETGILTFGFVQDSATCFEVTMKKSGVTAAPGFCSKTKVPYPKCSLRDIRTRVDPSGDSVVAITYSDAGGMGILWTASSASGAGGIYKDDCR